VAARRRTRPKAVTVFTDAQAAMARIASDEPGPTQQYARQARKWIAKLRERDRNVRIEFRWCTAHSGVAGNEEADKWAKQAAEEPDARGVEWMGYKDRYGRYHQLKTGRCRIGQYLKWTKNSNTAECGWCRYKTRTREHLFKNCDRWRPQQKIMWAEIGKKTGKGKNRFAIRELFADERCTGAILDFSRTTRVGARVGPRELPPEPTGEREEGDIGSP